MEALEFAIPGFLEAPHRGETSSRISSSAGVLPSRDIFGQNPGCDAFSFFGFLRYLVLCLLMGGVPPLGAAEKKGHASEALLSPDGRFPGEIEVTNGQQDSALSMPRPSAELLPLSDAGSPWIQQPSRALWSPDSQRLAFVTPTRRGALDGPLHPAGR